MRKVIKKRGTIKKKAEEAIEAIEHDFERESRLAMIQALAPLGLKVVEDELQQEVQSLAGPRYSRGGRMKRWGQNPGSVFLADQKNRINVPRVRDLVADEEVQLKSYERLQNPQVVDDMALARVIHGMSQRNYEKAYDIF